MKRPILLAALLATSSVIVQPAQAETASGTMLRCLTSALHRLASQLYRHRYSQFQPSNWHEQQLYVGSSSSRCECLCVQHRGLCRKVLPTPTRWHKSVATDDWYHTSAFNVSTASEASATSANTAVLRLPIALSIWLRMDGRLLQWPGATGRLGVPRCWCIWC